MRFKSEYIGLEEYGWELSKLSVVDHLITDVKFKMDPLSHHTFHFNSFKSFLLSTFY